MRARDLDWLEATRELRIGEVSTGHFGLWELHADLRRDEGVFLGVVMATFRRWPGDAPATAAREIRLAAPDVALLLASLRDGARTEPEPGARNVVIRDTSRGVQVFVDAQAPIDAAPGVRVAPRHVQFFVDTGEDEPQPWAVRGCEHTFAFDAQKATTKAFAAFAAKVGRDALYETLSASARARP